MSNSPKLSAEKSLLVGPTDPAHKIPGPSPDLPGIAAINGPLIVGGISDGYVSERYTRSMISVLPASGEVNDNPLSTSGEFFGPLADAITISKQGNPGAGSGNRYDGVGIRVNANAHKIEAGEYIQILSDKNTEIESKVKTLILGPSLEVDSESQFNKNVRVTKNVIAKGEVVSNNGSHVLSVKKNFDIHHPTKEGWRLTHSCIEGPEAAVYVRGKLINTNIIKLPEYWEKLVDPNTITVSITPIGAEQSLFIKSIENNTITIGGSDTQFSPLPIHCFYHVFGERIDTEKLIPEYEGSIENYPGDNSGRSIAGYHYDKKQLN